MTITLHKFIIHNRTTMGKASKVWKYFHKSPQNKDKVTCDVCEAILSSKGGVTTPLINHLKTHKQAFAEYEASKEKDSPKKKSSSSQPRQLFNQEKKQTWAEETRGSCDFEAKP